MSNTSYTRFVPSPSAPAPTSTKISSTSASSTSAPPTTMQPTHTSIPEYMDVEDFIKFLQATLGAFVRFSLPVKFIKLLFRSFFSEVERTMFNELLSRDDLCTTGNGIQIKLVISRMELWLSQKTVKPYIGNAR